MMSTVVEPLDVTHVPEHWTDVTVPKVTVCARRPETSRCLAALRLLGVRHDDDGLAVAADGYTRLCI